ncbi:hypothetical protein I7I53_04900 [Histoplasma capsulatum var. duboisii H88]|uniref:Uncharacterized protein n=1 Tax=Ajellomyces capsulatus (strain H88) TaxID=544711 RepID=A0A8A1LWV0_AJEC8|nr:hypothetical protein I7I53_04900 [Histoplasma capsulatum var. duboisii H88]
MWPRPLMCRFLNNGPVISNQESEYLITRLDTSHFFLFVHRNVQYTCMPVSGHQDLCVLSLLLRLLPDLPERRKCAASGRVPWRKFKFSFFEGGH